MKKYLFLTGLLVLLFSLAGCNKLASPEERLSEYTKLWNDEKFAEMYKSYVAPSSKKQVKEKDYVDRYETIYKSLGVKNIKVTSLAKEEKDWKGDKAVLPIKVKMDTSAGPVSFEKKAVLKKEEVDKKEAWFIDWDASYIFPQMEAGDKIRIKTTKGSRGQIFDRNGNSLAVNGHGYSVGVQAGEIDDNSAAKSKLASLLGVTTEFIDKQLQQSWVQPGYFVPLKELSAYEEQKLQQLRAIPGAAAEEITMRQYPYKEALGHLTGYIGDINSEELKKLKSKGYSAQDKVGKRGLEQLLEDQLRAQDGKKIYIEKEKGEPITVAEKAPKNGKDIKVAVDAELQKMMYEQFKGKPGTAAAVNPKTGEVLALASSPAFDPNEFVLGVSSSRYQQLENNPAKPLLNRFAATYAPGSSIKPITAAIALKAGTLDPAKERPIKGLKWQKDASWGSYSVTRVKDPGEPVNLQKAFIYSDNIYFAQTAIEAGKDNMTNGLRSFGLGEKFPFAYPIRASQISNSGTLDKEILLGDTGYGQGEVLTSMLHLASTYNAIVNDGVIMKPQLYAEAKPEVWKKDLLSKESADLLKQDLRLVVQKGTAKEADLPGFAIAGKTGTAEIKMEQGTTGKENGLFVAYDQQNPAFIMALMVEGAEEAGGSKAAIGISKQIFLKWKEMNS
ncbi:penicillin-binding transpeptidase domain-containing protein [Pseudobacillus wudalianchiensis]|uniref:serine-type D-Ala-D-Ala carboxypeptidase n=1 Tax=Pseudobacillus wudalianchiensis TaxID=1743143 RepID=A0A1B9AYL3_9BACI|nr:penicillin-binding transpeptidase domain-containing protein [Bacillus wudalianchiensis]OCA88972.1 peptidoglycan glycosyltransferase [Bacillus wudalianchiensis]